jgi:hypothetical protein
LGFAVLYNTVSAGPGLAGAYTSQTAPSGSGEILRDRAWFPYRLDFERGVAVFTRTNRDALSAQPFLDHRWNRAGAAFATLPIAELAAAPQPERAPGFIWHSAFCCSTLIASCLDWPGAALALKEPIALVDLATAHRQGDPRADAAVCKGLVRLLGRSFAPGARTLIKASNGAHGLTQATADAAGPVLMLHSSLRRFLLAVAKGGEARRAFVRSLMVDRAVLPGARFGPDEIVRLTDMHAAALLWRLQMEEFHAAAAQLGRERARMLDCEDFLADPALTLSELDDFFGLGLGAERIAQIVAGPKLRRHAKIPGAVYDAAREDHALADARRALGPYLETLETWSEALVGNSPPPAAAPAFEAAGAH